MAAATNTITTAATSGQSQPMESSQSTMDELEAKAVHKRYEGLVMIRTKAIRDKGAWYWAHLEPVLVHNSDMGLPKAVTLRCSLCEAVFSASNPSRTASEHLKHGTYPNFSTGPGPAHGPKPISTVSPPGNMVSLASPSSSTSSVPLQKTHRKRNSSGGGAAMPISYSVDPNRFPIDSSYPTRSDPLSALPAVPAVVSASGSGVERNFRA